MLVLLQVSSPNGERKATNRLRRKTDIHPIERRELMCNGIVVVIRSINVHEPGQIQPGLDIDLALRIVRDSRKGRSRRRGAAKFRNSRGDSPAANWGIFEEQFQTVGLPPFRLIDCVDGNVDKERRWINDGVPGRAGPYKVIVIVVKGRRINRELLLP